MKLKCFFKRLNDYFKIKRGRVIEYAEDMSGEETVKHHLLARIENENGFEGYNYIGTSSVIRCYIGRGTYINDNTILSDVWIGRFCSISTNVRILDGKHPSHFISTFPGFYSNRHENIITFADGIYYDEFVEKKYEDKYSTYIGNDVLIYSNVNIVEGVKIGDGAIVMSGSVVVKDVLPYEIVGGVPARHLKYRFDEDMRIELENFKWWEKDLEWLERNYKSFLDADSFKVLMN